MAIDDAAVRDLDLDLKQAPGSTELRLPSAIGCSGGAGLGFFGLVALLFSAFFVWTAWRTPERSVVSIVISSTIAIGVLLLLHRVTRWLRYGAIVRITPDRLLVKHHWSSGQPAIAIGLDQVRLEPDRRGVLVLGGRRKTMIGTGLGAEARDSVVAFLNGVIAGHLEPEADRTGDVAVASDGATAPDDEVPSIDADLLLVALCRRFRQVDAGGKESCVHLAPDIPPAVLTAALEGYLDIRDDEVLLGIVGANEKAPAAIGCALTTRRIYWPGKAARSAEGRPPRCRWLDHDSLPEAIGAAGVVVPAVDLGPGRRVRVAGGRKLRGALIAFLRTARSLARGEAADPAIWEAAGLEPYGLTASFLRGGASGPAAREAELRAARWAWPQVVAASREARAHRAELRGFQGRFLASRPLVTPALVGICIAVYALTVAAANMREAGRFEPDNRVMLEWGADFGPSIIFDGQAWRLFTNMFLHFSLMHLLLNMYCLATAGPIVERLFGHLGFAGLYVLSGLGGSIASLCVHPTVISAGASGAIFGVFGALLGFLAVRHVEVPAAKLKPMVSGALAFVGYNTIFALGVPGIDMAAHLGGLAAGFVVGLLLAAASPARTSARGRLAPVLGRLAVLAACSAMLAGSWPRVAEHARGRILADPTVGRAIATDRGAAEAWNAFHVASQPLFREFQRIEDGLNDVLSRGRDGRISDDEAARMIGRLKRDCQGLEPRIAGLPAANGEIRQVRQHLAAAQSFLLRMLTSVEQAIETGDQAHMDGPRGLSASNEAYIKEFEAIKGIRDAYFRAHSLRLEEEKR